MESLNVTTHSATTEYTAEIKINSWWIGCEIANCICILISIYIMVMLISHFYLSTRDLELSNAVNFKEENNHEHKCQTISSTQHSTNSSCNNNVLNTNQSRSPLALERLTVFGSVFVFLRIISEQLQLIFSATSDFHCNVIIKLEIVLYALPIATIYVFLWLRQRLLYQHPTMRLLSSRTTRVVSWVTLAMMIVAELGTALIFLIVRQYRSSEYGCLLKESSLANIIPWLIILVSSVIFQGSLLMLFVYPLWNQRNKMKSFQSEHQNIDVLRPIIVRVLVMTSVCVFSDVVAALVTLTTENILISNILYDFNLLVNLIGIVCSFKDWPERLTPFYGITINAKKSKRFRWIKRLTRGMGKGGNNRLNRLNQLKNTDVSSTV